MNILTNPFVQFIAASRRAMILLSFFFLAVGTLMQAAYIFAPLQSLPHRPFEEDTFFHLSVCRNLAAGKGLTIDGETPTSGAQPGTLVYSLAYLAAPDPLSLETLRLVRALGFFGSLLSTLAVFVCAFALLRTDTANRLPLALFSCAIWTASYQVYRTNLNGYETVFAVSFLLFSVAAYVWRFAAAGIYTYRARDIVVGVSLALAIYARIDLGLWALCAAIGFLFLSPEPLKRRMISVGVWALTAMLATLPFWYHNLTVGGSLMPISGKASAFQMSFHGFWTSVGNCLLRGFNSLGEVCFLSVYLPYSLNGSAVGLLAAVLGVSLLLWTLVFTKNVRSYLVHCIPKGVAIPILLFACLLFGYYVFAHGSWWFMRRYIHPERALFFTISGVYVSSLAYVFTRSSSLQWLRSSSIVILCIIMSAVSVGQFAVTWGDKASNQMYAVAEWINANIPATSKIGAFQSGTLGYFCNDVVNLDGKNNALALQAMTTGTGLEYIKDHNINFVVDWPSQIAKYVDFESFRKEFEPIARVGAFEIYRRK